MNKYFVYKKRREDDMYAWNAFWHERFTDLKAQLNQIQGAVLPEAMNEEKNKRENRKLQCAREDRVLAAAPLSKNVFPIASFQISTSRYYDISSASGTTST